MQVDHVMWYAFLAMKMMSVGHTSEAQKERTMVIYAMWTNMPINVGKLIFSQIYLSINKSIMALFFLMIITGLCARTEVFFNEDDEWLHLMKALDYTT